MKIRRFLCLILAMSIVLSCFAACSVEIDYGEDEQETSDTQSTKAPETIDGSDSEKPEDNSDKESQDNVDTDVEDVPNDDEPDASDEDTDNANKRTFRVRYRNAKGGTIVGATEQNVVEGENARPVTAVADEGYKFDSWSDGVKSARRTDKSVKTHITVYPVFIRQSLPDIQYQDHGMPIISIQTTDNADITSKEVYKACYVSIGNTTYAIDEQTAQIRGRGNSSWTNMPKKSYKLKFDSKISLFGSEYRAKDWTLIANYCDKSLSRNSVAHELASRMNGIAFVSAHHFVEVYLNGRYDGVYLLCDQIETGTGRVDVSEEFTTDGDTGYLVELDARAPSESILDHDYFTLSNDSDHYYRLRTPDTDDPLYNPDIYLEYIRSYMEEAMELILMYDTEVNENGNTEVASEIWAEICEMIDVDSFAEAYIVLEIMANLDCHAFSFYMYKEKGGKLYSGPLWDFDISSGNNHYGYGFDEGGIKEAYPDLDIQVYNELWVAKQNRWFRRLLRIPEFEQLVQEKLVEYEDTINEIISLVDTDNPNGYYKLYGTAMESNFERWDIMGVFVWPNPQKIVSITTVKGQLDYLHEWLTQRHEIVRNRFDLS